MMQPHPVHGVAPRLVVDTSERETVYLLVGSNGAYIRLSETAAHLLHHIGRGSSFEHIAAQVNRPGATAVTPGDIEAAYRRVIERIAEIEARGDQLRGAFWFRRRLVSEATVNRLARRCRAAFHPVVACILVAGLVAAAALGPTPALRFDPGLLWPAYGLFLGSLAAHELGHAAACARYGVRPSEIGFALYLIYPVFYSNVGAAWTLRRWQRVVVDLGGVYFQLLVGAGYAAAHAVSGWEPLRVALLLIAGSCVFSLNPILKFDGYWVIADALGVTNLGQQPQRVVRHLVARLRGRPAAPLPWRTPVAIAMVAYAALTVGFWIWCLWRFAPVLVPQVARAAIAVAGLAAAWLRAPAWPSGAALRDALTALYPLALTGVVAWRVVSRLARAARRPRARTSPALDTAQTHT